MKTTELLKKSILHNDDSLQFFMLLAKKKKTVPKDFQRQTPVNLLVNTGVRGQRGNDSRPRGHDSPQLSAARKGPPAPRRGRNQLLALGVELKTATSWRDVEVRGRCGRAGPNLL